MKSHSINIPPSDYHMHTPLCRHAVGHPSEYRDAARRAGIPEICFADHMPAPDGYDPAHRMDISQFPEYIRTVSSLKGENTPNVLVGIEADYYKGCEKFLREWIPGQLFDLVIGSIHFIDNWGFDNPEERHVWDSADIAGTWRKYFGLVGELADSGIFDVIGHLDLPKKFGHRPSDKDLKEMVKPALDRIASGNLGIELNTAGLRKPVGEIYPSPLILSLARERGIPVCFGSDAHKPDEVGFAFPEAVELAKDAGYREYFRISKRVREMVPLPESN